jgi:hypothetical protein
MERGTAAGYREGRMKNPAPETIRLMQAAVDTRDSLRRLAARIAAAGEDPQLRSQALAAAPQVATRHADLLRLASKDSSARRHSTMISEARPLWAASREAR